ncbi:MAG TPA: hypothetical protein VMS22_08345 [Candidatus Eisenbacteria bacterium]|nr:hypothetical protein [Candidatus Eisenbacteria bacterium]
MGTGTGIRGGRPAPTVAALVACAVLAGHAAGSSTAAFASIGAPELSVEVTERPGIVRLRILLPDDVPAGTIEVQVAGRRVVVLGQAVAGEQRRSRSLRLSQTVVEEGAQAAFDSDGSLTVTLRGSAIGEGTPRSPMRSEVPREDRP